MSRVVSILPVRFRLALIEFLGVPTLVVLAFILLAVVVYVVEMSNSPLTAPLRSLLASHVFNDSQSTGDLLSTVATSTITVTSITISLILLAVQQSAGGLTFQVIDQFLRRRLNQVTFGFFVGLALYSLIVLSTVSPPFNPILGAFIDLLLTGVALYLLLVLLYNTIDQMRPAEIIDAIHNHALAARERQLGLIRRTRRQPYSSPKERVVVRARSQGHVVEVDLDRLESAAKSAGSDSEIVLLVSVGGFVATGDPIAEIAVADSTRVREMTVAVVGGLHLAPKRDLDNDPGFGVEQLVNIGWTCISTSKQNPQPGLLAIRNLRDLLARWGGSLEMLEFEDADDGSGSNHAVGRTRVVYSDDVMETLTQALESLAVVSSESLQHQAMSEALRALAGCLELVSTPLKDRIEGVVLRILAALGDHVLTRTLETDLERMAAVLASDGRDEGANAVKEALAEMRRKVGRLNSRSTRVSK